MVVGVVGEAAAAMVRPPHNVISLAAKSEWQESGALHSIRRGVVLVVVIVVVVVVADCTRAF